MNKTFLKKIPLKQTSMALAIALTTSCASNDKDTPIQGKPYEIEKSYLANEFEQKDLGQVSDETESGKKRKAFESLATLSSKQGEQATAVEISKQFGENDVVTLAANNMPMNEFLHYAFGEVLQQNYVLAPDLKGVQTPVTLNISQAISKQEVYNLVSDLLARQQVTIDFNEGLFFLQASSLSKAKASIGIGRTLESVPSANGQILQVIPLKYGIRISMERTVRQLIDANITADFEQNALFVLGDKANVSRAIELVQMLDAPANRGQNIGLIALTYVPIEDMATQVKSLLENEGISTGIVNGRNMNVSLVPLNHIGAMAVFATSDELLNRVRYWVSVLDQPPQGDTEQYFVYNPRFARATDLGESIGNLLSLGRRPSSATRATASTGENANELRSEEVQPNSVVNGADVSFVVDERSNSLIFSTTGSHYQTLLPLLRRLDVLPKQVLLEVMIAEVQLRDQFSYGVEFALRNSSKLSVSTLGAFGQDSPAGLNLGFLDGGTEIRASFFEDDNYINVLSNPTLLVRDGVPATIEVGSNVPVVGGTATPQGGAVIQDIEYRQTGISVTVTPTVNAQGIVIMNIQQNSSNVEPGAVVSNQPSIFERTLDTEVVVESGKTVLLAGLISQNTNNSESRVPVLGDLPIIGGLFRGAENGTTKTELVMMVTPRVITQDDNWDKGLENIRLTK
jgi:general secretion pathway protein D